MGTVGFGDESAAGTRVRISAISPSYSMRLRPKLGCKVEGSSARFAWLAIHNMDVDSYHAF